MYAVRRWVVRKAASFEYVYRHFEPLFVRLEPLWRRLGYGRLEKPMAGIERVAKGFFFDCQMCGRCVLRSTGLSCPMNCPKSLRNGPCGGVRANGNCEIKPEMRCVWVEAWEGSRRMYMGDNIKVFQNPVDFRLRGTSSWLRHAREQSEVNAAAATASQDSNRAASP